MPLTLKKLTRAKSSPGPVSQYNNENTFITPNVKKVLETSSIAYFISHPILFTKTLKTHGVTPKHLIKNMIEYIDGLERWSDVDMFIKNIDRPDIALFNPHYSVNKNYLAHRKRM
jgi:hypothetical protein